MGIGHAKYRYTIRAVKGTANQTADFLSRCSCKSVIPSVRCNELNLNAKLLEMIMSVKCYINHY